VAIALRLVMRAITLFFAILLTVSACSDLTGYHGGSSRARLGGRSDSQDTNKMLEEGSRLQAAGKCNEAVSYFYHLAVMGQGFEIAQYHLAQCEMADSGSSGRSEKFLDGLLWMRRAAQAGYPEAQGALAVLYLEGPGWLRDPVEAAMWLSLYESNGRRRLVGFLPLAPETIARLRGVLSESDLAEGRRRSEAWKPAPWNPPDTSLIPQSGDSHIPRAGGHIWHPPTDGTPLL
jgi:hypothetical protein